MSSPSRRLIVPGLASAALLAVGIVGVVGPAQAGHTNQVIEADLSGRAEVGTTRAIAGDPNGAGELYVFGIDGDPSTLCYVLVVHRVEDGAPGSGSPFAAHLHRGEVGQNGPVVANLAFPQGGQSADCLSQDEAGKFVNGGTVAEILASPGSFYVNVHTAEYPGGAVRGQLAAQH